MSEERQKAEGKRPRTFVERDIIIVPANGGFEVWLDEITPGGTPPCWCETEERAVQWAEEKKTRIENLASNFTIRRRPAGCKA